MDNSTLNNRRTVLYPSLLLKVVTILLLSFFSPNVFAQLDLIHYVPPLYAGTSSYLDIEDHWVVLTTPSETPIDITIKNGDGSFSHVVTGVSKSTPQSVSLNQGQKGTIDNPPLGVVNSSSLNKPIIDQGLIFTSTQAFYVNIRHKSEIHGLSLTAKGQAALGTSFRSGHLYSVRGAETVSGWGNASRYWDRDKRKYIYYNDYSVVTHRSHFISVMATEDNTKVTFSDIKVANLTSDSKTALPVPASKKISVTLNAGESYVIGADLKYLEEDEANSLNGTKISSDKPIAVNSGSWCGGAGLYSSQDIGVDQIVPEKSVGREYILLKGKGNSETERPIVVATHDNTDIFVNGSTSKIKTLDHAGDSYAILTSQFINGVMLIKTNEDVYLYQTTSASDKKTYDRWGNLQTDYAYATVGMNFIPPLSALGFRQVDIPYVTELGETGIIAIYAQKGSDVYVNGSETALDSPLAVTGNEEWVVYKYVVERAYVGEVVNISVKSDKAIYVAMSVEDDAVGAAGYFSGFTKSISPINPDIAFSYDLGYVCSSKGGYFDLAINSTPTPDLYEWYEAKDPTDLLLFKDQNLNVKVSELADKYILKAYFRDPNMDILYNGDFAIGWGSSLTDLDDTQVFNLEDPGKVILTANPKSINNDFADFKDLDDTNGKMLLAHSSGNGLNDVIWKQTVYNDIPDNLFILKFYGRLAEVGTDQYLDIYVNDDKILTNFQLNDVNAWKSVKAFWEAGSAESAEIRIVDANQNGADAVFAIDSISFVPAIEATKEYNPNVVPSYTYTSYTKGFHMCEGAESETLDISYGDDMEWFTFLWEKGVISPTDTIYVPINDPTIKGLDTYKLKFNNVVDAHAGIYRCTIDFKETYESCGIDAEAISFIVNVYVDQQASMDPLSGITELCQGVSSHITTVVSGDFSVIRWTVYKDGETSPFVTLENSLSYYDFNYEGDYAAGKYKVRCEVVNGCSTDLYEDINIEIFGRPSLTNLDVPTNLCDSSPVDLTANLSTSLDGATMEYSWYRDNTLIVTNNSNILNIEPNISDTKYMVGVAARYDIGAASDLVCIGNEKTKNLIAGDIYPKLEFDLADVTLCEGVDFDYASDLKVTGDDYTYLWETPEDVDVIKTNANLSLKGITTDMQGNYKLTVTDRCETTFSDTGKLTITPKFEITGYTLSKEGPYCLNDEVTITINGNASAYVAENLRTNETRNLASNSFTIIVNTTTEGQWEVTAQNTCGDASIVIPINLVASFSKPTIISRDACVGGNMTLQAVVTSAPAGLTYQWKDQDENEIVGETSSTLVFNPVALSDDGEYTCVVSSGVCSTQEAKGTLSVDDITSALNQGSVDVCEGILHRFEISYEGTPTFAWYFNGTSLGVSTSYYEISSVAMVNDGLYSCVINSACGVEKFEQRLNVQKNVSVTKDESVELDICEVEQTTLTINVTGSYKSIKWYKDDILFNDDNIRTISTGILSDSGRFIYRYVVEGDCGDVDGTFEVNVHDKPSIVVDDVTSCEGDIPLSMTITGTDYDQASWLKPDLTLLGNGTDVTIIGATYAASRGNYTAKVSTVSCGDIMKTANVSIHKPVKVLTNSELNPTPCVGNPLSLSVTGEGDGLSYQWYKGTALLTGKTGTVLDLGNVDITDNGNYRCELISGYSCGNVDVNFVVDVLKDAKITLQPTAKTPCESDASVTFTVAGTGEGTLSYKWYDNNVEISDGADFYGATTTDLTVSNLSKYDTHLFHAEISGESCKSDVSNKVSLNVIKNITITTQPKNQTIDENETATFSVVATGGGTITYQWFVNTGSGFTSMGNTPISAQLKTLILTNMPLSSNGYEYYCEVSNVCDSKDSDIATLYVSADNRITSAVSNAKACEGNSFTFTVGYNNTTDDCTWEYDDGSGYSDASSLGSVVNGTTSSTLTVTTATTAMETDSWKFRARVKRADFEDNLSNAATVTVYEQVVIADISNTVLCPNLGGSFNVSTTAGTGPYTYEWSRVTSGDILGSSSSLSLTASEAVSEEYNVKVSSTVCPDVDKNFTITRHPDLVLTELAHTSPLCIGSDINLNAVLTEGPAIGATYVWTQNGTSVGSDDATYNKTKVTTSESGIYKVSVKDYCTTKTSSVSIDVLDAISLAAVSFSTQNVCEGEKFDLQVQGTGDALVYNWYKIDALGGAIVGSSLSTDKDYQVAGLTTIGANYYRCVLSSTLKDCTNPVQEFTVNILENVSVSDPAAITICEDGSTSTFSVTVTGETPYSYQWYNNSGKMSGETGSSISVDNVLANNGQNYYCIVGGTCKSDESEKASFTVNENVTITTQPDGVTVSDESTTPISFSVEATGTGLSYQWFENGSDMGSSPVSAQTKTLTLPAPGIADDGNTYYCVVSGDCIDATSKPATLTVNATVKITGQPQNTQICEGSPFTFEVKFKDIVTACDWEYDDGTLGYQPISSNADITMASFTSGDESNVLTINPSTFSMNGWKFRALVNGTEYSSAAKVTVYQKVNFADISDETLCIGTGKNFSVNVTAGTSPYTYEWKKGAAELSTTSNLNLDAASALDGTYTVSVTNALCPTVSKSFDISYYTDLVIDGITDIDPVCENDAEDLVVSITKDASLPVATYTWSKDGSPLVGSTNTYNIDGSSTSQTGLYKVAVYDGCVTKSISSFVNVLEDISLSTSSPLISNLCEGEDLNLRVTGYGVDLSYNWYKTTAPTISLSTDEDLSKLNMIAGDAGTYRCDLTSASGCNTDFIEFIVNVRKHATVDDPGNVSICQDTGYASFDVIATGNGTLEYKWYENDALIYTGPISELLIPSLLTNDGYSYHCVVKGDYCDEAVSEKAVLTVKENVSVTKQPVSVNVAEDVTAVFTVEASGAEPYSYLWYEDNGSGVFNPLAGQTFSTLSVKASVTNNNNKYYCEVKGNCTTINSAEAILTVDTDKRITAQSGNAKACVDKPFTFTVNYESDPLRTCTWEYDSGSGYVDASGIGTVSSEDSSDGTSSTSTLKVTSATIAMETLPWKFRARVKEGVLFVDTSDDFLVKVFTPTNFTAITNKVLCKNEGVSFTVSGVSGTEPYSYEWKQNGVQIGTNSSLSLNGAAADDDTYSIEVSNGVCPVIPKTFVISHYKDLVITKMPSIDPICEDVPEDLVVSITKDDALTDSYTWSKDGGPLVGSTNTYNIDGSSTSQTGLYKVDVYDGCMTKSISSFVNVLEDISLSTSSPNPTNLCEGEDLNLRVTGYGVDLSYNWYKTTAPTISLSTDEDLSKLNMIAGDAGTYRCDLTSASGCNTHFIEFIVNVRKHATVDDPGNVSICQDTGDASFDVTATGNGTLEYKWYENDVLIPASTTSTLSVASLLTKDGSSYHCVVKGDYCDEAVSEKAVLIVNENVTIITQPVSVSVSDVATDPVYFSVEATGTGLNYQWYKNGLSLGTYATADTKTLTVPSSDFVNNDVYYCKVTGTCSNDDSDPATLTISITDKITSQPQNTQICEGSSFFFNVKFKDITTTCVWEYSDDDGVTFKAIDITGSTVTSFTPSSSTVSTLTIGTPTYPSTYAMNGWKFRALVDGIASSVAKVTVYQKVSFDKIDDATLCIGTGKNFTVNVTAGTAPLTYQWKSGATEPFSDEWISGATILGTGSSLNLDAGAALDGTYSVSVTNALCPTVTKPFDISHYADLVLPVLTNESPLCINGEIDLNATPTSGPVLPVTYTWTQNGKSIDLDAATYNKKNVTTGESGIYKVSVKDYCTTKTASITIEVLDAISLARVSPESQNVCESEPFDLLVQGTGDNLSYDWYQITALGVSGTKIGESLPGDEVLHIDGLTSIGEIYYRCVLSSTPDCTNPVQEFTVNVGEDIGVGTLEPITVCENSESSIFTVTVPKGIPLTYQWYDNDVEMTGEEAASLSVDNILANNGHNYHVVVGGACKSAESNKALFTVNEDVTITSHPADRIINEMGSATFTVDATGTGLTYQWYENGVSMENSPASAQTNTLSLTSIPLSYSGNTYYCVVSGTCVNATSTVAILMLIKENRIIVQAENAVVCEGDLFTFDVQYKNTPNTDCVWEYDSGSGYVDASGLGKVDNDATSSILKLTAIADMNSWKYRARVKRTDYVDNVSNEVSVRVDIPASFDPIEDAQICNGTGASFSVNNLTGSTPNTYAWTEDIRDLGTNSSLSLTAAEATNGIYTVGVTAGVCPAVNESFSISHYPDLVLKDLVHDNTLCPEEKIDLTVETEIGSSVPETYVWSKDGSDILGASTASYEKLDVTDLESGLYEVTVEDKCMIQSKSIRIDILDIITKVSDEWEDESLCVGDALLFEAIVTGDSPVYTWSVPDGVTDPGNVATFNVDEVTEANEGPYECSVQGTCGDPVVYSANVLVNDVPNITTGLSLSAVCVGEALELGPIVYDATRGESILWKFENSDITGSATSLDLGMAEITEEGNYRVEVSNACGTDFSVGYQDVYPLPTLEPFADRIVCQGDNVVFRAETTGVGLTYTWMFDGVIDHSFDDKPEFIISNIQPEDVNTQKVHTVECLVSSCDTDLSATAKVTVNPTTILNKSLRGEVVYVGEPYVFELDVTGSNLIFEWHHSKADGSEETLSEVTNILTIESLSLEDAGEYYCNIMGDCGPRFTSGYLTVKDPLHVITGLSTKPIELCEGLPLNLNISVEGEVFSTKWFKDDVDLKHNDELNFSISSLTLEDAGTYTCKIVGEGARVEEVVKVNVLPNTVLNSSLKDQTLCEGKDDLSWSADVSGASLTYIWKDEDGVVSTSNNLLIAKVPVVAAGLYTVDVKGTCGDVSTEAYLTVKSLPRPDTYSKDLDLCENDDEAIFTATFTGDDLRYQWQKDGVDIKDANSTTLKIQNLRVDDAGDYTCIASSLCGSATSEIMNLKVTPQLEILSETPGMDVCDGEDAQFEIEVEGNDVVYQWQKDGVDITGENASLLTISPASLTEEGYYSCAVTDRCTTTKRYSNSKKLTVNALPESTISGRLVLCVFEDRVAYSTALQPDINYGWLVNGGEFTTPAEGVRTKVTWGDGDGESYLNLIITNEATGCTSKLNAPVELHPLPTVTLSSFKTKGICENDSPLAGGYPAGGIYWVDGVAQNSFDPGQGNGEYHVRYSYTDEYGCSNTTGENVLTVDSLPIVKIMDDVVVVGTCETKQLSATTDEDNILWSPNLYLDDRNSTTPTFTAGESTLYVATVVDDHGCKGNDIINVTVAPLPTITTINDTIIGECKEIELTTVISGDIDEITWTNPGDLDEPDNSNPMLINRQVGVTDYQINVTDKYGCVASGTVKVEVLPNPEVGESQNLCEGESLVIDTRDLSNPVWSDGFSDWERTIDKPGEYELRVEQNDCELVQKIVMNPTPKFELDHTVHPGIVIFQGETVTLEPDLNPDFSPYVYDWNDGSVLSQLVVSESGVYKLTVQDKFGCVATDTVEVLVKPIGIESPDAFTPLSDNENDRFYLKDINVTDDFKMYIYNRWGELIYEASEPGYAGGWDGTYRGEDCPVGTYVWIVFLDGKEKEKGTVTLLR